MAKLTSAFQFEGSIDGITVYKRWDIEKPIVRRKGHPSKQQIKTHENFDITRRNNVELAGRSKCASAFNKLFQPIKPVCDFNYMGPINSLLIPAQKADTISEYGTRGVLLSKTRSIVEGFNLNERNPFETILRSTFSCSFSREDMRMTVQLPAILPGRNFKPIGTFSAYRIIVSVGVIPDFHYNDKKGWYHNLPLDTIFPVVDYGKWTSVYEETEAKTLELVLDHELQSDDYTVVVAAGISFGLVKGQDNYKEVRGAGCGKVIGVF